MRCRPQARGRQAIWYSGRRQLGAPLAGSVWTAHGPDTLPPWLTVQGMHFSVSEQLNAAFLHQPLGLSSGTLCVDCGQRGPDYGGRKEPSDYTGTTASAAGQARLRRHQYTYSLSRQRNVLEKQNTLDPVGSRNQVELSLSRTDGYHVILVRSLFPRSR